MELPHKTVLSSCRSSWNSSLWLLHHGF